METIREKIHSYLKSKPGQLVSAKQIASAVYNKRKMDSKLKAKIRVHLCELRSEIDDEIETHTAYRLKPKTRSLPK